MYSGMPRCRRIARKSDSVSAWTLALAVLVLVSCSGAPSVAGPPPRSSAGQRTAGLTGLPVESHAVHLECSDAATGIAPPDPNATTIAGISGSFLDGRRITLNDTAPKVVANGRQYVTTKAFVNVLPTVADTTLTVVAPVDAWLYYVPFATWSSGNPHSPPVPNGISKEFRLASCPVTDGPAGYTGEILVGEASCVKIRISASGPAVDRIVLIPLGVPSC